MNCLLNDVEVGLLKNKRVGMIRRRVKMCGGVMFKELSYFPIVNNLYLVIVKERFGK